MKRSKDNMSDAAEVAQGIIALVIGGFLFLVIGSALADTISMPPLLDLRLWGILYLGGAVVIVIGLVYTLIQALTN